MDYYYYDQLGGNELDDVEDDYDYDAMLLPDESFKDIYQGCIKSSTKQVQQYIAILLGCGFLQRLFWEVVKRLIDSKHQNYYHLISIVCGLISLWFYVGINSSVYMCLYILNLNLSLKLTVALKLKSTGIILCIYTIVSQLFFEYLLKLEEYDTIRGLQMVVSMKLISVAFEIQDEKGEYHLLPYLGYLVSPSSLILGPWISFKDYRQFSNAKVKIITLVVRIIFNIFVAIVFLNLSNCIIPWIKQFLAFGLWWGTYLDAFSVRCSHYFVCYLSQATLLTSISSSYSNTFMSIVNPLAIEFPRSLSDVVRNWNIPMHIWLKQNIFNRLQSAQYSYFIAVLVTYLVSCLVHGFNYKVHLVLISLGFFSYFENILRRYLAQVFDSCIESSVCKQNCKYSHCPRRSPEAYFSHDLLLVRLVNFAFSLLVIFQLSYLGVMLNASSTPKGTNNIGSDLFVWSNMTFMGHIIALIMFGFYKCI